MDKNTLFSSFSKWIAPINRNKLDDCVEKTGQDRYVKKLTTRAYLLLFLHAHLEKRDGLRAIADDALQEEFQQELELTSISAAQLSRKHKRVERRVKNRRFFHCVPVCKQIQVGHVSKDESRRKNSPSFQLSE